MRRLNGIASSEFSLMVILADHEATVIQDLWCGRLRFHAPSFC
jgi:hypothetical protein